jgi:hypothetical protein
MKYKKFIVIEIRKEKKRGVGYGKNISQKTIPSILPVFENSI